MPAIVDIPTGAVVTNDYHADDAGSVDGMEGLPPGGRARPVPRARCATEIDEVSKRVYTEVNNGVYRCGFAGSQEAYEAAYDRLVHRAWTG